MQTPPPKDAWSLHVVILSKCVFVFEIFFWLWDCPDPPRKNFQNFKSDSQKSSLRSSGKKVFFFSVCLPYIFSDFDLVIFFLGVLSGTFPCRPRRSPVDLSHGNVPTEPPTAVLFIYITGTFLVKPRMSSCRFIAQERSRPKKDVFVSIYIPQERSHPKTKKVFCGFISQERSHVILMLFVWRGVFLHDIDQ
jgi:hypothetical protein